MNLCKLCWDYVLDNDDYPVHTECLRRLREMYAEDKK